MVEQRADVFSVGPGLSGVPNPCFSVPDIAGARYGAGEIFWATDTTPGFIFSYTAGGGNV